VIAAFFTETSWEVLLVVGVLFPLASWMFFKLGRDTERIDAHLRERRAYLRGSQHGWNAGFRCAQQIGAQAFFGLMRAGNTKENPEGRQPSGALDKQ